MIGALFNALTGRTDMNIRGRKIDASAGQRAINMQMDRAGRQNAGLQYSLAAGARGSNQGLAVREAQRRAQLGAGQIAETGAIAQQQLQQGVAEANQRALIQSDQINAEIAAGNAAGLGRMAGAAVGGAALAMSDENAKQPLSVASQGMYHQATGGPDDGRRVAWVESPQQPTSLQGFEFAPRVSTPVTTMGGPYQEPTPRMGPPPAQQRPNFGQAFGQLYMSDERSKQKIAELEATNRGLSAMLARAKPAAPATPAMRPAIQPGAVSSAPITPPATPRIVPVQPTYDVTSTPQPGMLRVGSSEPIPRDEQQQLDVSAIEREMMSDYRSKMMSDERAKDVTSYLRPVRPVAYEYRPEFQGAPGTDSGPQVGLLAQHLERSPIGATVVEQGPDGMKRVQVPQLLMLNTAADAEQQRDIDELKRRTRRA